MTFDLFWSPSGTIRLKTSDPQILCPLLKKHMVVPLQQLLSGCFNPQNATFSFSKAISQAGLINFL